MPKPKLTRALTLSDQRKLAQFASRPDLAPTMELRLFLLDKLKENKDWFWQRLEALMQSGTREDDSAIKLMIRLLDSLMPTYKESQVTRPDKADAGKAQAPVVIKILNVQRGTKEARDAAIVVEDGKRKQLAELTTDGSRPSTH